MEYIIYWTHESKTFRSVHSCIRYNICVLCMVSVSDGAAHLVVWMMRQIVQSMWKLSASLSVCQWHSIRWTTAIVGAGTHAQMPQTRARTNAFAHTHTRTDTNKKHQIDHYLVSTNLWLKGRTRTRIVRKMKKKHILVRISSFQPTLKHNRRAMTIEKL